MVYIEEIKLTWQEIPSYSGHILRTLTKTVLALGNISKPKKLVLIIEIIYNFKGLVCIINELLLGTTWW